MASDANDYLIDRQIQKSESFSGIWGLNPQDRALQEGMPNLPGEFFGLTDRRGEHLVRSDLPIMTARRLLARMARESADGHEPAAAMGGKHHGVRAIAMVSDIGDFGELLEKHGHELKGRVAPTQSGVGTGEARVGTLVRAVQS